MAWCPSGLRYVRRLSGGKESEIVRCSNPRRLAPVNAKVSTSPSQGKGAGALAKEFKILCLLDHAAFLRPFACGSQDGREFYVYEHHHAVPLSHREKALEESDFDELLLGLMGALIVDHHVSACLGQELRHGATDATGSSSNEGDLALLRPFRSSHASPQLSMFKISWSPFGSSI